LSARKRPDGPRTAAAEELPKLLRFLNHVFKTGATSTIERCYPSLYSPANLHNLLVITYQDEVISHGGVVYKEVRLFNQTLKVGFIGAVATDEDHRGRGYASKILRALIKKMKDDGVDASVAWSERGELFNALGWESAGAEVVGKIEASRPAGEYPFDIVDFIDDYDALYQIYSAKKANTVIRSFDYMKRNLGHPHRRTLLAKRSNMTVAYLVYEMKQSETHVLELEGDASACGFLLNRLVMLEELPYVRLFGNPFDSSTYALVGELDYDIGDLGMWRLISRTSLKKKIEQARVKVPPPYWKLSDTELVKALFGQSRFFDLESKKKQLPLKLYVGRLDRTWNES